MDKERPTLDKKISIKDFKDFYWLKVELIGFWKPVSFYSSFIRLFQTKHWGKDVR